ncbi:hypothetical protein G5T09_04150 [Legionella pneumophila serogroup 1]|uniref:SDH family Clp fold serine proteinase n=1 Tax=Legionella pneumophila TaxID=446 RepID=UPI0007709564|nr:hypothetical protein [Legionella pneumophila]HAT8945096.1 hypothetical protein [Legionella pneumophila subsp. pneumophila]MCH9059927.1 hypothetical protein [Legionella pneumophila serogroup 1]MCH9063076.1 hypothetical protein [Legionella pneumophila serogroup 1]MCH9065711.1 hypothetical protein [Legionella pneumophila serogroup 1]MCH9069056.1 hypothetical protein [Legionella pneumophila serogroup 1]
MNTDPLNSKPINENTTDYDLSRFDGIYKLIKNEKIDFIKQKIIEFARTKLPENKYFYLFMYKPNESINSFDSDTIYWAISDCRDKDILLTINSNGGQIEPAYFISKICKEKSKNKFIASIPSRAKSAATLIALGADEIHMGSLSELGPIDPQFKGLPALSLSSALECICDLCKRYPETSSMFAEYLSKTLTLEQLGYFERISGSAEHYAQRLLENKSGSLANKPEKISHRLVYEYKDHAFVIDKDEAKEIFGSNVVKIDTDEYAIASEIYHFLEKVSLILKYEKNLDLKIVGTIDQMDFVDIK